MSDGAQGLRATKPTPSWRRAVALAASVALHGFITGACASFSQPVNYSHHFDRTDGVEVHLVRDSGGWMLSMTTCTRDTTIGLEMRARTSSEALDAYLLGVNEAFGFFHLVFEMAEQSISLKDWDDAALLLIVARVLVDEAWAPTLFGAPDFPDVGTWVAGNRSAPSETRTAYMLTEVARWIQAMDEHARQQGIATIRRWRSKGCPRAN